MEVKFELNDVCKTFAKQTVYSVEATDFEQSILWEKWANDGVFRVKWVALNPGGAVTVGEIGGKPVTVSVRFAEIAGLIVCFYEATSVAVDHDLIQDWREKQFPHRWANCDANNFHQCIHALQDMKK